MNKTAVLEWARKRMATANDTPLEPGFRYHHGLRVAALAAWLAERMGAPEDPAILEVACVLHDIGKSGYRGAGLHGPRGRRIIRREAAHWLAEEELERVCRIVEHHYARPRSQWYAARPKPVWPTEVLLVQDADLLDHFGCNHVWRSFCWARQLRRPPRECIEAYWRNPEDPNWREEAWRSLNFEISRAELTLRLARSDAFFEAYAREQF